MRPLLASWLFWTALALCNAPPVRGATPFRYPARPKPAQAGAPGNTANKIGTVAAGRSAVPHTTSALTMLVIE
ncbi:MAG: hypothetical protein IT228_09830 [Flavobacteriales bacterium]|nr:hypothetical protein [Flavobacteriales bacterium]MCC6577626.1 hypothetical protein [Flavobacteriales bacterium]NUQ14270.1 hypothetical protein [Flavobacteriales bacterium]